MQRYTSRDRRYSMAACHAMNDAHVIRRRRLRGLLAHCAIRAYSLLSDVAIQRTSLNVSLTPALVRFIAERVASGRYQSASEVIRAALRLLEQNDPREDKLSSRKTRAGA